MEKTFTIGISTRALFDLEKEHRIFEEQGAKAYVDYQIAREHEVLSPGPAFRLIQAFLSLNVPGEEPMIQVVIMSKNSADSALRIFHSIDHYGLAIKKAALTTGGAIAPYLRAYGVDLYLSFCSSDVQDALTSGIAAGVLLHHLPRSQKPIRQIRIAFDGDAVLFTGEAEKVYLQEGIEAFCNREKEKALEPLEPGPFAHVLCLIAAIQKQQEDERDDQELSPIRTALVTARSAPAHERVIRTLQAWGVRIDEAFFLGGMDKSAVLRAFGAHIFFDDNEENTRSASQVVLAARVPRLVEYETAV